MYKKFAENERESERAEWWPWVNDKCISEEEKRLRNIISGAFLRLSRLDDSNPEVCHAREILKSALSGGRGSWP